MHSTRRSSLVETLSLKNWIGSIVTALSQTMIAIASMGKLNQATAGLVATAVIIHAIMHNGGTAMHSAMRRKRFAEVRFKRPGCQTYFANWCGVTIAMNAVRKNASGFDSSACHGIGSSP